MRKYLRKIALLAACIAAPIGATVAQTSPGGGEGGLSRCFWTADGCGCAFWETCGSEQTCPGSGWCYVP
jgi:hypothetical protein